jgi:hypothetical protein
MLPLDVAASKGFEFSEYQLHGNTTRHKPGWIATAPGSSIDLRLSTLLAATAAAGGSVPPYAVPRQRQPPAGQNASRGVPLQVVVGYLSSYEHMGRVAVTCRSGCTCAPTAIDAHITEKMSVLRLHEFAVSPAAECVVRLEVTKDSSSPGKEHKFKLLQVAVRGSAAAA